MRIMACTTRGGVMSSAFFVGIVGMVGLGCGDKGQASAGTMSDGSGPSTDSASTTEATTGTATDTGTTTATATATEGTGSASASSTGNASTTETTGCSFIDCNDGGGGASQCDPLAQDCPEGEKCTAVSETAGEPWEVNVCVSVTGEGGLGDPCDIEGGKYTGLDNCGLGYICLLTDDEGNDGSCVEFCDANMTCPDSGAKCVVYNDGSLPICLTNCNPLVQDCLVGQGCYPSGGETFVCFKTSVEVGEGGVGDGCNYTNQCQPGLMCVAPAAVPDCQESGCCSLFCSVMEGNEVCLPGQECLPYFEMGQSPPGFEDVGVCQLPG